MPRCVRSHTFVPSDFVLASDGVCRLHPQYGRFAEVSMDQDVSTGL